MPDLHLRQPEYTYSRCGLFTKHLKKIQKFTVIGDLKQIYKNESVKACFGQDAAYSDNKYSAK